MIDNFAVKIEENVDTFCMYSAIMGFRMLNRFTENDFCEISGRTQTSILKVDEYNFDFMDVYPDEVPAIIKERYLNRKNCWRILAAIDDKDLGSRMRQAASVGAIGGAQAWPGHVVANSKYKSAFASRNDLYKWHTRPWDITHDDATDGIIMYYKNLRNNNLWNYTLFYKELSDHRVRLFHTAEYSHCSAFENYVYLNETYDGLSLDDVPKFKSGDFVEYIDASVEYVTGIREIRRGTVNHHVKNSNFTGHKGFRYLIYQEGTDTTKKYPRGDQSYEIDMKLV